MLLSDVVTIDKEIMSGAPVFKGTRVPVKNLLDYLEGGYDIEVFLDHFPAVKREQVIKFLEALRREYLLNDSVPENDIVQQRSDFANLLNSLGQASFSEIEKIMQEREVVEPEPGLTPEVMQRLQERIANQKMQLNRT